MLTKNIKNQYTNWLLTNLNKLKKLQKNLSKTLGMGTIYKNEIKTLRISLICNTNAGIKNILKHTTRTITDFAKLYCVNLMFYLKWTINTK